MSDDTLREVLEPTRTQVSEYVERTGPVEPYVPNPVYECTVCGAQFGTDRDAALECHPDGGPPETVECDGCGATVPLGTVMDRGDDGPYCEACMRVLGAGDFEDAAGVWRGSSAWEPGASL